MDRRELLGVLGAGAVGLTSLTARSASAQGGQHRQHDKVHEDCLKACSDCEQSCDATFDHCCKEIEAGHKEHIKALRLLSDCEEFCSLSACMIGKHSPLMAHSCAACAEACKATAAEVETFESPEMQAAAKALRVCERSCRAMVASMKGHGGHHQEPNAQDVPTEKKGEPKRVEEPRNPQLD